MSHIRYYRAQNDFVQRIETPYQTKDTSHSTEMIPFNPKRGKVKVRPQHRLDEPLGPLWGGGSSVVDVNEINIVADVKHQSQGKDDKSTRYVSNDKDDIILRLLSMQEREERYLRKMSIKETTKKVEEAESGNIPLEDLSTRDMIRELDISENIDEQDKVNTADDWEMDDTRHQNMEEGKKDELEEKELEMSESQPQSTSNVIGQSDRKLQEDDVSISSSTSLQSRKPKDLVVVSRKKESTLPVSKVREKLKDLNAYVLDHTSRKIMVAWNTIEARFQRSSLFKTEIVKDDSGLSHPIKHPAIYLNALTSVLCSVKVRVVHNELPKIYSYFNCTEEDILHSRRVSAIRLLLGPNNGAGLKQAPELQAELQQLLKERDEVLVSIDELKKCVFPRDPVQLLEVEKNLQQERNELAEALILEKKKKEEVQLHNEIRKQKALGDWDSTLKEIQFVKGKFSVAKHQALKEVIKFAEQSVAAFHAAKDLTIPHEIIHLLGWEAFPRNIIEYLEESDKKIKDAQVQKRDSAAKKKELLRNLEAAKANTKQRFGHDGGFRIKLQGPPFALDVLRETVSYCKGLNGNSFRDVVEWLQAYASIRIQSAIRAYLKRWRYRAARKMWYIKFYQHKLEHFKAWAVLTKHCFDTRDFAWRPLKAWAFYTRRASRRRAFFRDCHWPFYVWRRWAQSNATAKEKARFLTSRVMPLVRVIAVFRAWKGYSMGSSELIKRADKIIFDRNISLLRLQLRWLHRWAFRRKRLRRSWLKEGFVKHCEALHKLMSFPFFVWRSYVFYKITIRRRAHALAPNYRKSVLDKVPLMPAPNRTERRNFLIEDRKRRKRERKEREAKREEERKQKEAEEELAKKLMEEAASQGEGTFDDSVSAALASSISSVTSALKSTANTGGSVTSVPVNKKSSFAVAPVKSEKQIKKEEEALTQSRRDLVFRSLRGPFGWTIPSPSTFDIDSDLEDFEDLPPLWQDKYRDIDPPLVPVASVNFMDRADSFSIEKVNNMAKIFKYTENWAMMETATRFHKFGRRAFQNLRYHAIIAKNSRIAVREYQKRMMSLVFGAFLQWMVRDSSASGLTEAERVKFAIRQTRLSKMIRRRDTVNELKLHMSRDDSDDDNPSSRSGNKKGKRNKRGKPTTTVPSSPTSKASNKADSESKIEGIDPNHKSESRGESGGGSRKKHKDQEKLRDKGEQKEEMIDVSVKESEPPTYKPPDLLLWDQKDREIETILVSKMMSLSKKLKDKTTNFVQVADFESNLLVEAELNRDRIVQETMDQESKNVDESLQLEEKYVSEFKIHAAAHLVQVLHDIHKEIQATLSHLEKKKYFRALKLPMLKRISKSIYNRKKIVNWIRICKRLSSLRANADFYRKRRQQWIIFNRWLKFVEKGSLNSTPGLVSMLKKRRVLLPAFDNNLKSKGFTKTIYINNQRLKSATTDMSAIFARWVSHTQEEILFREMEEIAAKKFRITLLQKCFYCIRYFMSPSDTLVQRESSKPFLLQRYECDLEQMSKYFIAYRKPGLPLSIRNYIRAYSYYQKKAARRTPTFKSFLDRFTTQIEKRVVAEQEELTNAFFARGTQTFKDVAAPGLKDGKFPILMSRTEGKVFYDPVPENRFSPGDLGPDQMSETIPGGFKIHKLRLNFLEGLGIVGWQVVWSGDSYPRDIEGPKRGKWKGGAMRNEEVTIPNDDFIIGAEYLYEGNVIYGLRFKLFHGGWTKMAGEKQSLSTLSLYLDINLAPREPFEDKYISPGADEDENPGLPRNFVIGFFGIEGKTRATCMGLIVRKVKTQNIFSYYWVQDAIRMKHDNDTGKNAGASIVFAGQTNPKPHYIAVNGEFPSDESLTYASSSHRLPSITHGSQRRNDHMSYDNEDDNASHQSSSTISTFYSRSGHERGNAESHSHAHRSPKKKLAEPLSRSEEQFFEMLRMRTAEVRVAEKRAEELARKLWTDKLLRKHPVMSKLTSVLIVSQLTKWFFEAINKRLVRGTGIEHKGLKLLEEASMMRVRADMVQRRFAGLINHVNSIENAPQIWHGKTMLGPVERKARKDHIQLIQTYREEIASSRLEVSRLWEEAKDREDLGKSMLPRLQLSTTVCNNFYLKIAAARQKENLLERMDLEQFRTALMGGGSNKSGALSQSDMDMIAMSLEFGEGRSKHVYSLEDLVEDELQNMHKREETIQPHRQQSSLTLNLSIGGSFSASASTNALIDKKNNDNTNLLSVSLDRGQSDLISSSRDMTESTKRKNRVLAVNPAHYLQTGKKMYKNYLGSVDSNMKTGQRKQLQLADMQHEALELSSLPPSARSSFSFSPGNL